MLLHRHYLHSVFQVCDPASDVCSAAPVGQMMINSLVMAIVIAVGKIAISIISAFAIIYFRFPLKNFFFWMIFTSRSFTVLGKFLIAVTITLPPYKL